MNTPPLQENIFDIIQGCRNNIPKYQEQLYRHCYPEMIKTCLRYTSGDLDTAGLLYNQSMLKVFRKISQFRNEGEFMGWVRTTVVHVCIDHCRSRAKFKTKELTGPSVHVISVVPDVYHKLSGNEIMNLVNQLPRNTSLVFNLFVIEGYKHEEIGNILGISSGTSKWHLNEARRLLKEKIDLVFKKENLANAI